MQEGLIGPALFCSSRDQLGRRLRSDEGEVCLASLANRFWGAVLGAGGGSCSFRFRPCFGGRRTAAISLAGQLIYQELRTPALAGNINGNAVVPMACGDRDVAA